MANKTDFEIYKDFFLACEAIPKQGDRDTLITEFYYQLMIAKQEIDKTNGVSNRVITFESKITGMDIIMQNCDKVKELFTEAKRLILECNNIKVEIETVATES